MNEFGKGKNREDEERPCHRKELIDRLLREPGVVQNIPVKGRLFVPILLPVDP